MFISSVTTNKYVMLSFKGTKVQGDAVRELLNKIDIAAQWAPFAQQIGVSRPTVEQIHAENGHSITERKG